MKTKKGFMDFIASQNPDIFGKRKDGVVYEWIAEGWGLCDRPSPEQIAAALLMEANTQDVCVDDGESDPFYPPRLRNIAYQILNHFHADKRSSPMKIGDRYIPAY